MSAPLVVRASLIARVMRTMRHCLAGKRGNAAVEFALIAPVLLGLLVPIADYGLYIYDQMQLQLAAQAGTEYAAKVGWVPDGIKNAIIQAAPSLNLTADNVTPQPFDAAHAMFCGCTDGNTIATQTCNDPNTGQRATCAKNPGVLVGTYVSVGATYEYHTLFNYPGIPSSQTLSASTVVVRIN
jgi:Flp pilus assembly protein TadG